MRAFQCAFFTLNLTLCAFFLDTWITPNPTSRALPVLALFEEKTLRIDTHHRLTIDKSLVKGHYYSDKAPLSTFVVIPFYGTLRFLGLENWGVQRFAIGPVAFNRGHRQIYMDPQQMPIYPVLRLGSFVCGSLPFVVMMWITFSSIRPQSASFCPLLLTCMAFYGSYLFVYSGVYFGHLLAGLFLLLAYRAVQEQRYFCSGILLALAFLTEYPLALMFPIWLLVILIRVKRLRAVIAFSAGMVPGVVLNAAYTAAITGHPFKMVYSFVSDPMFSRMKTQLGFGWPQPAAIWGLVCSQYKGLLLYAPVLIVGLVVVLRFHGFDWRRDLVNYLVPACSAYLLFIASYYMWWGGWAYGPRHLIPIAVLLIYECVRLVSRHAGAAKFFLPVATMGVFASWLAKATIVFYVPDKYKRPLFEFVLPEFIKNHINPNNWLTAAWGVEPLVAVWVWVPFFGISMLVLNRWHRKIVARQPAV